MNDVEYKEHLELNKHWKNKDVPSKRSINVQAMVHDIAWANGKRTNLPPDILNTAQEHLDNFRNKLCCQLSIMNDSDIPETIEDQREFVFTRWDIFVDEYKESHK